MKKLLVAAIGVATAVGAFADTISTKRFEEGTTVGNVETISSLNTLAGGTDFWSDGSAISNVYKIGAVDALGGIVSQPTPLGTPTKALDVATRFGEPLNLNIQDGGTTTNIPNSGLYFDSLVKFTVCDGDPDEAYYGQGGAYEGAKIVMWLKSEDDINTNLMVRAGYLSYDNGVKVTNKTYTCAVPSGFDASGFNRVTIKAISDITAGGLKVPAFAIYINGKTDGTQAKLVSCNEAKWDNTFTADLTPTAADLNSSLKKGLFPSLVQTGGLKTQLASVSFDGTGAITDLAFTDVAPEFAADVADPEVTGVYVDGEEQDIGTLADAITAVNGASTSAAIKLNKTVAITEPLVFTGTATITLDFAGFVLTNALADAAITNSAATLIITNSSNTAGGIYCSGDKDALALVGGTTTIDAGVIGGKINPITSLGINGGYFAQDDMVLHNYLNNDRKKLSNDAGMASLFGKNIYGLVDITYYTVTYAANGGDLQDDDSVEVEEGSTVTKPEDPTRTGYTFTGWYYNDGTGLVPFRFDDDESEAGPVEVESDLTLTAQWEQDVVTWASLLGEAVDGAYLIDNLTELKAFQANVGTLPTTNTTFKLTADIALDAAWPGIGIQNGKDLVSYTVGTKSGNITQEEADRRDAAYIAGAFRGIFDGQNHTISGFQIIGKGDNAEGLDYAGFFNSTLGATIQNLKIQYAGSTFATDTTSSTHESGATFVGVAKNSTLRNLTTVAGTVSCSKGFGGIVGYLYGTTVDSCTNNVNMTSLANNKCGGIAMICQKADCSISNCENNGTMTTTSGEHGGIVGYTDTITINNCKNTAACKMFYHHGGTVTLQGTNTGNATVQSYTGNATPGLKFATVDGNVATFVADDALALNGEYKVMATNVTATFAFAEAGTIAFDQALFTPTNYAITAAQGLTLTDATSGTVKTYTAAEPGPVTPTIDPADPAPVEVTAVDADAAIAAVTLETPTGVDKAAYKALFDITATETSAGSGKYTVTVAGIKESVEAAVEGSAMDIIGEKSNTVTVPAGLYYKVTTYETLGGTPTVAIEPVLSTGAASSAITKPGTTQGFIKVEMATTAAELAD